MNRIFVNQKQDNCFLLTSEDLKHLKVLRITDKPFICVYNQEFYKCTLANDRALIQEKLNLNHELPFEVVLAIGVIKFERFEWLLQKATELGVTKIIPMITNYTNGELIKFNKFEKKRERFEQILKNAAEQSFRNKIPTLDKLTKFEDVANLNYDFKIIAHEKNSIQDALSDKINQNVLFLVGPEGGFSDQEIEKALNSGFISVSLGSRILRAETAGLFLLSQIKIQ
ncbi:16S rRNA (uracil(1498)-N(3))-methyltransferase [Mycoplasmopsis gallopavonis]|uniref:Ribosomal RNA small subunit methyltransferase E n=1 Tax=Mycoplasmopsis gallopavonis TaxID=76629 RepID=A0A449AZT2_9BACT|nr:16S rRNA (uracil(1498)-N(3))-methyltransferase [Mycoplasmopsis gallopavonis]RIV16900.1 16S rRNA (uracil(1498)-N(3))-methyltransferase [Mycoplasmopsis gallopavonis]VEU73020.1 RsmE family RNA methyltransferase [Mycoplasmopsis gallopavonis]